MYCTYLPNLVRLKPQLVCPQLSKKYGSVVTIWLTSTPVVIISGYHALKETMVGLGEEFSGRSNYPLIMKATLGYGGFT